MRMIKFYTVGLLGFLVQLGALGLLVHVMSLHYLAATALAVEAAILHNFFWHRRWTWRDRKENGGSFWSSLIRFHIANGLVSMAGNLIFMLALTGELGVRPLLANVCSVILCAVLNYFLADRMVFLKRDDGERRTDLRFETEESIN